MLPQLTYKYPTFTDDQKLELYCCCSCLSNVNQKYSGIKITSGNTILHEFTFKDCTSGVFTHPSGYLVYGTRLNELPKLPRDVIYNKFYVDSNNSLLPNQYQPKNNYPNPSGFGSSDLWISGIKGYATCILPFYKNTFTQTNLYNYIETSGNFIYSGTLEKNLNGNIYNEPHEVYLIFDFPFKFNNGNGDVVSLPICNAQAPRFPSSFPTYFGDESYILEGSLSFQNPPNSSNLSYNSSNMVLYDRTTKTERAISLNKNHEVALNIHSNNDIFKYFLADQISEEIPSFPASTLYIEEFGQPKLPVLDISVSLEAINFAGTAVNPNNSNNTSAFDITAYFPKLIGKFAIISGVSLPITSVNKRYYSGIGADAETYYSPPTFVEPERFPSQYYYNNKNSGIITPKNHSGYMVSTPGSVNRPGFHILIYNFNCFSRLSGILTSTSSIQQTVTAYIDYVTEINFDSSIYVPPTSDSQLDLSVEWF